MPTTWCARSGVVRAPGVVRSVNAERRSQVRPSSSEATTCTQSPLVHFAEPRAKRCPPPALLIETRLKLAGTGSGPEGVLDAAVLGGGGGTTGAVTVTVLVTVARVTGSRDAVAGLASSPTPVTPPHATAPTTTPSHCSRGLR